MEAGEYRKMFEVEDTLWWHRGLRLFFADAIRSAALPADAVALDAGCGSGANMALLGESVPRVVGCDLVERALLFARLRGLKRLVAADINRLPFREGSFDCVLCSDVFECEEVDERHAISELARVTKRGGRLIIGVAAYQFLLSEHDRAVHSVRRYTKARARTAFAIPALRIVRMRYRFGWVLLPVVLYRMVRRRQDGTGLPRSDLFLPSRFLNALLFWIVRWERSVSRWLPLPFGTTVLVELRRV